MEMQMGLEEQTKLILEDNRFIRAVKRLTGRDIFPSIDAAAEAAEKDPTAHTNLVAETGRAYAQGKRRENYAPELEYWGVNLQLGEINTFLKAVYQSGRSEAPQKPVLRQYAPAQTSPVSIRYLHGG